jgi:ubiquinone/menaquinone biosynthesis C-methylase UbiE
MADVRATFGGSMPEYYDGIMAAGQFDIFAQDLVARVPVDPAGGVLELACGTGVATRRLRERLHRDVRLVATDLSEPMLAFARRKLAGTPGIEWRQADAGALPFGDGEFGAVLCACGVMFVPDKNKLFGELRRVLAPGGALVFNVWDGIDANPHSLATNEVFMSLFPGDAEMRFDLPFAFNDQALLRSLLAQAGFRDVRIEPVTREVRFASAQELAIGQLRGTPRGALLEKRGLDLEAIIGKCAAALARVGGAEPFRCSARALAIEARAA